MLVLAKDFTLSKPQLELLNKGLTFIPTVNINKNQRRQLETDIQNYHRKIKLASYFKESQPKNLLPYMAPSIWTPPPDKVPPQVNLLIQKDQDTFKTHFKHFKEKGNLSYDEIKAIRQLSQNKSIIIKPADKGSVVVILGREQYIMEAHRQLDNTTYYKKLKEPIYLKTIPVVHNILNELHKKKYINSRQKQYLKGECQPRARRFYILPKIHKDPQTWTVPLEVPPGRPIVSDCGSETYKTAEYIDYHLNPLSIKHPSYIKDTYHFIDIVKNLQIPQNSSFFTIDIDSLYTNIDTQAGLLAVRNIMTKYPNIKRPDQAILKLLEINLTKNDFEFNGQFYLQIKGTAMGKKFAPAYANIFMADWEEKALAKCPKKPLHYYRYLDDIWGIWTYSREDFDEFIKILNTHDASITLKYVSNDHSVDFLDTTTFKGPTFTHTHKLDIKVHFKDTDTHALLFKTSFHPTHTYRGLIKSQLLRFRKICTRSSDFITAVKLLFSALRHRGYSRSFLRHCLKNYEEQKPKIDTNMIPLITTFSTISRVMNNKLKDNFKTMIQDQGLLESFQVISAYRRNKNLKDLLVKATLTPLHQKTNKILLQVFCKLNFVRNMHTKTNFIIKQQFTPQTSNCVYVIFCKKCGKQYVGETKNSIATRMTQHRYNLRHKINTNTPLVKHFISHGPESIRIAGLQHHSTWTDMERKKMERRWIFLLDTKEPIGLNMTYETK